MSWHLDILTPRQHGVLLQLAPLLRRFSLYLAGGTGVALHLGHWRSVDLDFFTAEELPDPMLLAQTLREEGVSFATTQVAPGTLSGVVRGVRVGFLEYRYALLTKLLPGPGGIRIAARADLAAMKLTALAQRGGKKDFVDIYALGVRRCSLRQMLRWYQEKYAVRDVAHVLYSLAYFDDADQQRMPRLFWDLRWRTVKGTIRSWLRDLRP